MAADVSKVPVAVLSMFEHYALYMIEKGFHRSSADFILHKIRWEMIVERGDRTFKCNNNWTAQLSRWFMEKWPEYEGFFEIRNPPNTGHSREDWVPIQPHP